MRELRELRDFEDILRENLKNPIEAKAYLDVALELYDEDKDTESFLMALRDVAEAQGGITPLSERTNLNRQNLYKALSGQGNPRLNTLGTILHGLGFKLAVQHLDQPGQHTNH